MTLAARVLGPLEITVDGRVHRLSAPKRRALLAALVAAAGRPVPAPRLVDELWPGEPPATATSALQVHVSALRKVVGPALRTTPGGYLLALGPAELDAARFEALLADAREQPARRPDLAADRLAEALALWRGDAFEDVPAGPAVRVAAARLAGLRQRAYEDWGRAALAAGRHAEVAAGLAGPVGADPTRERLTGLLMLALHRCERRSDARAAYAGLRRALHELGAEPGEEVSQLAVAIDRGDPTLAAPPAASLPAPTTRFVGRRRELEQLAGVLRGHRLLTLTGPGGAGKTRLALELTRDVAAAHPDGLHFVELAGLAPGSPVAAQVAAAVGVREQPGESVVATVADRLRHDRALLVLDNCEHVRAAAAVARLLRESPGLRVLATSRQPLGLPGEVVWPVSGLEVPPPGAPAAELARSDAVRLFVQRGGAARPGMVVGPREIELMAAACRRLDGLPLGIELAAARQRALALPDLVARLDRRLDLLTTHPTTGPGTGTGSGSGSDGSDGGTAGRHATLRAALDWSHDLLSPAEQAAFRRVAVFAGSFGLPAAEAVGADLPGLVDLLGALVDRSVLTALPDPEATRYRMLETVREYAAERLAAAGETAAARRAHAAWYRELVETAPPAGGADHETWLRRFDAERDNLRAVLDWSLGDGADPGTALVVAGRGWWYWWLTGQMAEGRGWLDRALAAATAPPAGDPAPGTAAGTATGTPTGTETGTGTGTETGTETRIGIAGGADPAEVNAGLRAAAALARSSGDLPAARRLGERCAAGYRRAGDDGGLAAALNGLAITCLAQSDLDAALAYGQESLDLARAAGNGRGEAISTNTVAGALRCQGRLAEAGELFGAALDSFRAAGDRRGEAAALTNLAMVARRRGDPTGARRQALAALAGYRELEIVEGQLDALEELAGQAVADRPAHALRLLLLAERERRRLGAPLLLPDEIADRADARAAAVAALGPDRRAAVTAEAAAADLDTVVAELLERA